MFGGTRLFLLTCLLAGDIPVVNPQVVDPCTSYGIVYMYDKRRSTDYKTVIDVDRPICDWSPNPEDSWVRFDHEVGTRLPETCVSIYRCGTQMPIWMNGTHPEADGEVVERQVCANYYDESCCDWSGTIQVKKCAAFFVYKLTNPPGCSIAYCVDGNSHKECGSGFLWSREFLYCYENGTNPTPPTTTTTTTTTTTPTPSTPTPDPNVTQPTLPAPTSPPPGSWSPWNNWGPCSKTCDRGLRARLRYCLHPPCNGSGFETETCAWNQCPEKDSEKLIGLTVILALSGTTIFGGTKFSLWSTLMSTANDTIEKVVENEDQLLDIWMRRINEECKLNAAICCQKTVSSSDSTDFVKSEDIWTASGYPQQYQQNDAALKFIVTINPLADKNVCQRSGENQTTYIVPSVLQAAVNKSVDDVASGIGLAVVESTVPAVAPPVTTEVPDTRTSCELEIWVIAVIAAEGALIVLLLVIVIILAVILHGKPKSSQSTQEVSGDDNHAAENATSSSAQQTPDDEHFGNQIRRGDERRMTPVET